MTESKQNIPRIKRQAWRSILMIFAILIMIWATWLVFSTPSVSQVVFIGTLSILGFAISATGFLSRNLSAISYTLMMGVLLVSGLAALLVFVMMIQQEGATPSELLGTPSLLGWLEIVLIILLTSVIGNVAAETDVRVQAIRDAETKASTIWLTKARND